MTTPRDEEEAEAARIRNWLRLGDRVIGKKSVRDGDGGPEPLEEDPEERVPDQR